MHIKDYVSTKAKMSYNLKEGVGACRLLKNWVSSRSQSDGAFS
jgi:hypothetical protein